MAGASISNAPSPGEANRIFALWRPKRAFSLMSASRSDIDFKATRIVIFVAWQRRKGWVLRRSVFPARALPNCGGRGFRAREDTTSRSAVRYIEEQRIVGHPDSRFPRRVSRPFNIRRSGLDGQWVSITERRRASGRPPYTVADARRSLPGRRSPIDARYPTSLFSASGLSQLFAADAQLPGRTALKASPTNPIRLYRRVGTRARRRLGVHRAKTVVPPPSRPALHNAAEREWAAS